MKFSPQFRSIRKPSPRTWLGASLVAVSIAGTVAVIGAERQGTMIVLASHFIPAGTVVTESDVAFARIVDGGQGIVREATDVIGRRTATDIGPGEIVASRLIDSSLDGRRLVTVPVTTTPSRELVSGSRVQLWTVSGTHSLPPQLVAVDAVIVAVRDSGFGQGGLLDVSIGARDEMRVISALGSDDTVVAVMGDTRA